MSDPLSLLAANVGPLLLLAVLDLALHLRMHVLILRSVVANSWELALLDFNLALEVLSWHAFEYVGVVLLRLDLEHCFGALGEGLHGLLRLVHTFLTGFVAKLFQVLGLNLALLDLLVVIRFLQRCGYSRCSQLTKIF